MIVKRKEINYFDILKRATLLTWKHKFLWLFGMVIFFSLLVTAFYVNTNILSPKNEGSALATFFQAHPNLLVFFNLAFLITSVCLFLARLLANAALIKSAGNIVVYKQVPLWQILSEVKAYLKLLLLLELIINFALVLVFFILIVPVAYLFLDQKLISGLIIFFAAAIIFLPLVLLAFYLRKFTYFYLTLGNVSLKVAIEAAYELFSKNFKASLWMGTTAMILALFAVIAAAFSLLILAVLISPITFIAYLLFAKVGVIVMLIFGGVIGCIIFLLIASWYVALSQTAWLIFFQELSLQKKQKENLEEKMKIKVIVPSPEAI